MNAVDLVFYFCINFRYITIIIDKYFSVDRCQENPKTIHRDFNKREENKGKSLRMNIFVPCVRVVLMQQITNNNACYALVNIIVSGSSTDRGVHLYGNTEAWKHKFTEGETHVSEV